LSKSFPIVDNKVTGNYEGGANQSTS